MQAFQRAQAQAQQQMADFQAADALAVQQFNDQMQRDSDEAAARNAQNAPTAPPFAAAFKFSVKSGTYSKPTTVKITDSTRGATIYYTMDGWTPTTSSTRYVGPISH